MDLHISGRGLKYVARAIWNKNGVTVLKGSVINSNLQQSYKFASSVIKARTDKDIVSDDGSVLKDVVFSSLTSAAQFVTGRSINGRKSWRNDEGCLVCDIERKGK